MSRTSHVWGVDPATHSLAFGFAPLDGGPVTVETLITKTDIPGTTGARYGSLDRQLRTAARQFAGNYPCEAVWVEQPSGRHVHPSLWYTVGVVLAGLAEVVPAPVWTVPPSAWKRRSCGFGNASKAQVRAWVEARQPNDDFSQDECDAVAIALAGRAMTITGQWDARAA